MPEKYLYNESMSISRSTRLRYSLYLRFAKRGIFPQIRIFFYKKLGVKFGKDVSVGLEMDIIDYSLGKYLFIGDRVAIAPNVTFVISSSPNNSKLKTIYPRIYGPIKVEEDVWIGSGAIILPGIRIGKYSIVGAGSIVTKDVQPFTVVAGNPAKVIKKLGTVTES